MANRFQKLIYYLSAEAPVLMILALLWIIDKSKWESPIKISWEVPLVDKEGEGVKETGRRRLFLMKENLGD